MYCLHHQVERIGELGITLVVMPQPLITANVVSSSLILFTLMMEVICSTETSILKRATQCHIPEDSILQPMLKFTVENKSHNCINFLDISVHRSKQ
jgi:hypothetical protein